jgi:protein involved in polysaccharide export with SLBB domain/capsular polysaccharide biosynthesis protein
MNENTDASQGRIRKRPEQGHDFYSASAAGAGPQTGGNGTTPSAPHGKSSNFDAWTGLQILARRWDWLVLGAIIAGAGFFYLAWYVIQPKFTATGQLLRYETPGASEFFRSGPMTPETFAGLLRSPDLMEAVGKTATPAIPPERLTKMIKIEPLPDNDIVKISLVARDQGTAVALLNNYLSACTKFTREMQQQQAAKVERDYLSNQVAKMQADVDRVQEQFMSRGGPAHLTNKLTELSGTLSALGTNLATARPASPVTARLQARLDKSLIEYFDLLSTYTDIHPKVQAKMTEIEDLKKQMASAATNSFGIMTNLSAASAAAVAMTPTVGDPARNGPDPEADILHIRYLSLNEGLVQLLTRLREAKLYADDPPGMCKIFAPAVPATVASNMRWVKVSAVSVFGAILGMAASLMLVLLVEATDKRLHTSEDVHRVTKLPVLTTLGDLRTMNPKERTQWAFRTWTMLQGCLSPTPNHGLICGITSSASGEGRSTWINLLADAASHTGFRVLTIATKPSATHVGTQTAAEEEPSAQPEQAPQDPEGSNVRYAYEPPHPGESPEAAFENDGNSSVEEAAMHVKGANGHANGSFNGGEVAHNVLNTPSKVTEQLNSQPMVHIPLPGWVWNLERRKQWREALSQWRSIDNLVIFVELPPADVAEAVLLGSNLPNLVWLAESGTAHAGDTRAQLETLRHARCNLVGAVLNRERSASLKSYFPRWVACLAAVVVVAAQSGRAAEPIPTRSIEVAIAATGQGAAEAAADQIALGKIGGGSSEVAQASPTGSSTAGVATETPSSKLPAGIRKVGSFSISDPSQKAAWQQKLTLGPADVLNFSLYGAPELTRNEITISSDGRVGYLEAQDVVATGLTVDELRGKMDQELGRFRRSPRTMITPVRFQSKRYYILGKVMTKGVYVLDRPMTVLEAIARAHGLENALLDRNIVDLADFHHAFLARGGSRYPLNFEQLFQQGDLSENIPIEPGDYIFLPPITAGEVYVVGEVRLPGTTIYNPSLTIMSAIAARGGYSERGYKAKVIVVRGSINAPEKIVVDTHAILDGKAPDFKLQPRDIIYVNSRPFIRVEEVADLAATAFIQSIITAAVGVDVVKPIK